MKELITLVLRAKHIFLGGKDYFKVQATLDFSKFSIAPAKPLFKKIIALQCVKTYKNDFYLIRFIGHYRVV